MKVRVRLFAGLREYVGQAELELELPDNARVSDLQETIGRDYPRLKPLLPGLAFAVNEEYATRDQALHEDDEVALIPPISGGQ
jgi:molybdopterin synthase catalytic subunit